MTYVITPLCEGVCDAACVDVCPMDCIHGLLDHDEIRRAHTLPPEERDALLAGHQLYINPDLCIDCDACRSVCPVEAIFPDGELPPEHEASKGENARFFEAAV